MKVSASLAKNEPYRSEPYLRHVRNQVCCCSRFASKRCGGPMHAHHHGKHGISTKTSDLHTVPLCTYHHDEFHRSGCVEPFDRGATDLLFAQAMVESLSLALRLGLKL